MIARPSFLALMFILGGFSSAVVESADNDEPLVLRGRVVDTSGKPVAGVSVEIRVWPPAVDGVARMPQEVNFRGKPGRGIRTGSDGRYYCQMPRELNRNWAYQARVDPPGCEPAETLALRPSVHDETELADLVVRRVTTISGRVVDRQGRGVGGANVFQAGDLAQRVQTTTDADGRFRLERVLADPTFAFVTMPGFRFYGRQLAGDEDAATFMLTRTDEPAEAWHSLTPALSKDERVELSLKVLRPCLEAAEIYGEARAAVTLEALSLVDPPALLARLDQKPLNSKFLQAFLKQSAIKSLAANEPDEALAMIATIDDPFPRSAGYLNVVDSLANHRRARKLELLGQATVSVRQISSPFVRMSYLGQTAGRLLDLGDSGEATNLLREGEKLAHGLPQDEFGACARGAFAEDLGQIDLPAALKLMNGLTDAKEHDRHHGNLAHELAAKDPAAAERLLAMLHTAQEWSQAQEPYDLWAVRVCYRMAPVDLPRAQRIADTMTDPYLKAQAYGVMAQAIAKQEPRAARESIERAFGVLEKLATAREAARPGGKRSPATCDDYNGQFSASSLAGSLLPAVEAVDPALVPEYAWRAVSFRLPRVGGDAEQINARRANAALAMTLARYNRELAEAVFKLGGVFGGSPDPGLAALVLIDPARAATAIEKFDADHADDAARADLAELLVLEGDALWRKLNDIIALWSVDVEDIF